MCDDKKYILIDMLFDSRPIEEFESLLKSEKKGLSWGRLLHMCYCEESYESVGGDEGCLPNPPINHERLSYLKELIAFLEGNGIKDAEDD